jgi:hypothetical protein
MLRNYVTSGLDMQKEYLWSSREDPSYFADTLSEYEEHALYKDTVATNRQAQRDTIQA